MPQPEKLRFQTFWRQSNGAFRALLLSTTVACLALGLALLAGLIMETIFGTQPINKVIDGISATILIVLICSAEAAFVLSVLSIPAVLWQERKRPSLRLWIAFGLTIIYAIAWLYLKKTIGAED